MTVATRTDYRFDRTSNPDANQHPLINQSGSMRRTLVATTALGLLTIGGSVAWRWPTNDVVETPGPVLDLAKRITIDRTAATVTPIDGTLDGLTVVLRPLDVGHLLLHHLSGDPAVVVPQSDVEPAEVSHTVYEAFEKAAYVDGSQLAAAVAERALGHQVAITTDGLEILAVQPGSPGHAAGLTNGDVIRAISGVAASSNQQIPKAIAAAHGGPIELEIIRNGSQRTVRVTAAVLDGSAAPVLGVIAGPANPTVDLPIPVKVDASGVVGPSAGLMTALTIYDELSPIDLARGRHIAGTGTIDADGTIGEIGGIEAKARAAQASGAQLFLAPTSQAAAARAVLGDRIPVIAVSTFAEALNALSGRNQLAARS